MIRDDGGGQSAKAHHTGVDSSTSNVIRAFTADHVVRLTGLSKNQLHYWDRTGFFRPRYASEDRRQPYSRVYSFRDVVGLRALGVLRRHHAISLQHLRKVAQELVQYKGEPWSDITLYVLGKEVHFREPDSGRVRAVVSGQYVSIPLQSIITDVARAASQLKERSEDKVGRIERHRYVAHNAWVIAGTRIPTKAVWRYKNAGYSIDDIIKEYPSLTAKDVQAALAHEEQLAKTA